MCFDIDVRKLSLQQLRDTLRRVSYLLSRPATVASLPDNGYQLRLLRTNLAKELEFREALENTQSHLQQLQIHSGSDSDLLNPHSTRLCSMERKTERERYKPNLSRRSVASGKTESEKNLRSKTKLIDLTTSLNLQKAQEDRAKAQQAKLKQEKVFTFTGGFPARDDDDLSFTMTPPSEFHAQEYNTTDEEDDLPQDEPRPTLIYRAEGDASTSKEPDPDIELDFSPSFDDYETVLQVQEAEPERPPIKRRGGASTSKEPDLISAEPQRIIKIKRATIPVPEPDSDDSDSEKEEEGAVGGQLWLNAKAKLGEGGTSEESEFTLLYDSESTASYSETSRDALGSSREVVAASGDILGTRDNLNTSAENLGTSGYNLVTAGDNLGSSEGNIETSRENLAIPGENLGTPEEILETSDENLGTPEENLGIPGENMGTSEENLETSEENPVNSGHLPGTFKKL